LCRLVGVLAFDIHQHLWPEGVLRALAARADPPYARWENGCWTIALAGEPAFRIDPADHDPQDRADAVTGLGLDRALVALSSAIGIEALPARESLPIIEAWHEEASSLGPELQTWAAVPLSLSGDEQVAIADDALDAGAAGVCVPAAALAGPAGLTALAPLLQRLEDRLVPLFVHPGPTPAGPSPAAWWAPATSYVAELHAAWHSFAAWGRPAHRGLHVVFAALAGLAPLHLQRTAGRGGPAADTALDPLTFYDTSSYGTRARRTMAATVGTAQLVHGSDHPVLAATRPPECDLALCTDNAARLLGLSWVAA
jgi:hypothetical protein